MGLFGGGGGGGGSDKAAKAVQKMMEQQRAELKRYADLYTESYNRARSRNAIRYNEAIGRRRDMHTRAMDELQGYGDIYKTDINRAFDRQGAELGQGTVGQGMANTSLYTTRQLDNNAQRADQLSRVQDQITSRRTTLDNDLEEALLFLKERVEDAYPDNEELIRASIMAGAPPAGGIGSAGLSGGRGGLNIGGALSGGLSGAAAGALAGSVIPGLGTLLGAGIGLGVGGLGGLFGGGG